MKFLKIVLIFLTLFSVSALSLSCSREQDSAATENTVVTVQRGDLTIDITAVGNLILSQKENLAFEIPGTVAEILVEEGDSVEEGQVVATLDTTDWDTQLSALEDRVTAAKNQLTAKEDTLVNVENQVPDKKLSLRQALINAQINLQTAEDSLSKIPNIEKAQKAVDDAEYALKFAKSMLAGEFGGVIILVDPLYWMQLKGRAEQQLAEAKKDLQDILSGSSLTISSDVALEVSKRQLQVEQAQRQLEVAQKAIDDYDTATAIEDAKQDVEEAKQAVEDAQEELEEARKKSSIITAPFDGFITKVNVKGGAEVKKGTVAVELADPNKFETDILVSETDIYQVKVGGNATVQVDAMQTIVLPAKVTRIAPTATIQSGVVNYKVKVELKSLQEAMQEQQAAQQQAMQEQQAARQQAMPNITPEGLSERLKQAVEAGRMTQEQADAMIKRIESGEMPFQPGEGGTFFQRGEGQGQIPFTTEGGLTQPTIAEDFQLREGLTVTVSITVNERNNVLLVPNGGITTKGRQTYVNAVLADGTTEERLIQTGISDWQYTEVTSGLSEGEQVVVPKGTTTTSTTQQQRPQQTIGIPGGGGFFIR